MHLRNYEKNYRRFFNGNSLIPYLHTDCKEEFIKNVSVNFRYILPIRLFKKYMHNDIRITNEKYNIGR